MSDFAKSFVPTTGTIIDANQSRFFQSRATIEFLSRPQKPKRQRKTDAEYKRASRAAQTTAKIEHIAVLDFETDPFDNDPSKLPGDLKPVMPFAASLYCPGHFDEVFWKEKGEDHAAFLRRIFSFIERLPDRFIIFAHNGGKFDFMFLIPFIRGDIQFKGRAIMLARIGQHELRDSFHIIPEKLANWKKDSFDYSKLLPSKRDKHKNNIIRYMCSDARYLHEIVTAFVTDFGWKISIGQAAISQLRKAGYRVQKISEFRDEQLRPYLFGGRVECLAGKGHFTKGRGASFKLYDVNSMYPDAMARFRHPIGSEYSPRRGNPNSYTCFVNLSCRNFGAFPARAENLDTTFDIREGNFLVSIHEYNAALELGLIENVDIHWCIDNNEFSSFERFVTPIYGKRENEYKPWLKANKHLQGTDAFDHVKKDDMFSKFLLNNCWGKFTQNPRRFRDNYITAIGEKPGEETDSWGHFPKIECPDLGYAIWQRDSFPRKYFNVGTGASVTGAARSVLMRGINAAVDPIYCDTDSIICRDLPGVEIHPTRLGAWDIEAEFSEVIIAGKKLYACRDIKYAEFGNRDALKIRSKGVSFIDPVLWEADQSRLKEQERAWSEMHSLLLDDYEKTIRAFGPTLSKAGTQQYMERRVRSTAARQTIPNFHARQKLARSREG
jgi:hypothetical protein